MSHYSLYVINDSLMLYFFRKSNKYLQVHTFYVAAMMTVRFAAKRLKTVNLRKYQCIMGTAVAQWLRYCATNRRVTGSIPDGVIGIFH
jgi:hypothetical protein